MAREGIRIESVGYLLFLVKWELACHNFSSHNGHLMTYFQQKPYIIIVSFLTRIIKHVPLQKTTHGTPNTLGNVKKKKKHYSVLH